MLWSILIPTTESRIWYFDRLMKILQPQLDPDVELLVLKDDAESPIGRKRQTLLERTRGCYASFIDDDDMIPEDYVCQIRSAMTTAPDAVGFRVNRYVDGRLMGEAVHSVAPHSHPRTYPPKFKVYHRFPNHLNPIRADWALEIGFKPINIGEDNDYMRRMRTAHPEMSEVFIDAHLYDYLLRTDRGWEATNEGRK